jgi:mono/diheme cytochrome c family protein
MGLNGAKVLPESQLNLEQRINLIHNGKGVMPPFKNLLSPAEIEAVAVYTQSLK